MTASPNKPRRSVVLLRAQRRRFTKLVRTANFRTQVYVHNAVYRAQRGIVGGLRSLEKFSATIGAFFLSGLLLGYLYQTPDQKLSETDLHLACAGIIGTALALVLTLSIVPAQKAADSFSSAILRLYAEDRQLRAVIGVLCILALVSLFLGTGVTSGLPAQWAIVGQVAVMGLALDALRWFYARTLMLLDPTTALTLVREKCSEAIRRTKRFVDRAVHIYRLSGEKLDEGAEQTPAWMLYSNSKISHQLTGWIEQLEEFARKAVARVDTHSAVAATRTMTAIGLEYVDSRRDSIVTQPDFSTAIPVSVSDVGNVLNPIYESIKGICDDAAGRPNEDVVRGCIEALGTFAEHAMTVVHNDRRAGDTAPLAFAPVFYLKGCASRASSAGMDDALLSAVRGLSRLYSRMTSTMNSREAEASGFDCLFEIAVASYGRGASIVGFEALKIMLEASRKELRVRQVQRSRLFDAVLKNIGVLLPIEVLADRARPRGLQVFPPYSPMFPSNLAAIVGDVARAVKADTERDWVDPFADFEDVSKRTVHHFRDAAKSVQFKGELIQKWMLDTAFQIAEVHVQLLRSPPEGSEDDLRTVKDRLTWWVHTPQYFFGSQHTFSTQYARDAANDLAILGMKLIELGSSDTATACGRAIAAIAQRSVEAKTSPYETADILKGLGYLERAADALGDASATAAFRALSIPKVSPEVTTEYLDAKRTRTDHIDQELSRSERDFAMPDDPATVLRGILNRAGKSSSG